MSLRPTLEMGIAVPTIEGAGVNLHRDIGFLGPFELVPQFSIIGNNSLALSFILFADKNAKIWL